ncbi:MAG TPA: M48 family metallopeptidase [Clostridiales bacterium]|nr:M48 family metallopeptidase [Clostridiales bacterium]
MNDRKINIEIIRSSRRTIAMEITRDLRVLVRAPFRMPDSDVQRFIKDKSSWLYKHLELAKKKIEMYEQQEKTAAKLTREEISQLADKALRVIPERAAFYAPAVGVKFGKITIRNQKTRWGSCSSKGNLNFNCLLMLAPPEVIDYVVVHELCHIKELNHSARFWSEVERVLPDYKEPKEWLKKNGNGLIQRMRQK